MLNRPPYTPHFNDVVLTRGILDILEPIVSAPEATGNVRDADKTVVSMLKALDKAIRDANQERGSFGRARAFFHCECLVAECEQEIMPSSLTTYLTNVLHVLFLIRIPLAVLTHHQDCSRLPCQLAREGRLASAEASKQQKRPMLGAIKC